MFKSAPSATGVSSQQDFTKEWSEYLKNAQAGAALPSAAATDRGQIAVAAPTAAGIQTPTAAAATAVAQQSAGGQVTYKYLILSVSSLIFLRITRPSGLNTIVSIGPYIINNSMLLQQLLLLGKHLPHKLLSYL